MQALPRQTPRRGCQNLSSLGVSGMPKVKTVHTTVSKRATPSGSLAWGGWGSQAACLEHVCIMLFPVFPGHMQPHQGGEVTKYRSSPLHRSSPPSYLPIRGGAATVSAEERKGPRSSVFFSRTCFHQKLTCIKSQLASRRRPL